MELPAPCAIGKSTRWLGRRHAAVLVEGQSAGLHVDLARRGGLAAEASGLPLALSLTALLRRRLGRDGRRHARPHQRNLHRPGGRRLSALLVVLELVALDAVHAAAVFSVQLDLHVVQQRAVALFSCTTFEA